MVCPYCEIVFEPKVPHQKYCGALCGDRGRATKNYRQKKEKRGPLPERHETRVCEACSAPYDYRLRCGRKPKFCLPCAEKKYPSQSQTRPRLCGRAA